MKQFHYVENVHPKGKGIPRAIAKMTVDHWIVFNAPRPIFGHETWTGDFLTGIFYAAVDDRRPDAEWMIKENTRLDAVRLVFHSWSEVEAHKEDVCLRNHADPAEFSPRDFLPSFLHKIQN